MKRLTLLALLLTAAVASAWPTPGPGRHDFSGGGGGGGVTQLTYIADMETTPTTSCSGEDPIGSAIGSLTDENADNADCDYTTSVAKGSEAAYDDFIGLRYDWPDEVSAVNYQMRVAVHFPTAPADIGFFLLFDSTVLPGNDDNLWVNLNGGTRFDLNCDGTGGGNFGATINTSDWFWLTLSYDVTAETITACAETSEHDGSTCASGSATCTLTTDTDLIWDRFDIGADPGDYAVDEIQAGAYTP